MEGSSRNTYKGYMDKAKGGRIKGGRPGEWRGGNGETTILSKQLKRRRKSGLRSFVLEIFLMDNAPWLGRPAEVDSNQIETLLEEKNQRSTTRERANILKISKSIVIVENEKRVFYFMDFLGQLNTMNRSSATVKNSLSKIFQRY